MKKSLLIVLAVFFVFYMFGCAKKEQAAEELQEPMSMEAMSTMPSEVKTTQAAQAPQAKLEPLPPAGPYKPTNKEIQLALKNANLYMGAIDGIMGPKTKKAIEEFQRANGLKVDGKIGPKTWALLSAHLNPLPPAPTTSTKR